MFSPINFLVTLIKEIATESPRAYTPFRLAVKSSQPLLGPLLLRRAPSAGACEPGIGFAKIMPASAM